MKRNPILIFGMLCMLALGSCGGGGEQKNLTHEDSIAIFNALLTKAGYKDIGNEKIESFFDVQPTSTNGIPGYVVPPQEWVFKDNGIGDTILADSAYAQINRFIGGASIYEPRSYFISRRVFEHYLENQYVTHFKLCIASGRDDDGEGPINGNKRTLVVLGVDKDGRFVTINYGGKQYVYDQIAPCPAFCPSQTLTGPARCDYPSHATKCYIGE